MRSRVLVLAILLLATVSVRPASPLPVLPWHGRWTPYDASQSYIAVHMALLRDSTMGPTGYHSKIIWWNDEHELGIHGGIYGWRPDSMDVCVSFPDTAHMRALPLASAPYHIFCGGLGQMADGKFLVAGGTEPTGEVGAALSTFYDPTQNQWSTPASPMAYGRWYPTVTALPDRRGMVTSGSMYPHMQQFGGIASTTGLGTDVLRRLGLRTTGGGIWDPPVSTYYSTSGALWPAPRDGHTFTESTDDHQGAILFGGRDTSGTYLGDAYFMLSVHQPFASDNGYYFQHFVSDNFGIRRADHVAVNEKAAGASRFGLLVFGGRNATTVLGDAQWLHVVSGAWRWDAVTTGAGADTVYGHVGFYDAKRHRLLVFGGARTIGGTPSDSTVYALDLSNPGGTCNWSTPPVIAHSGIPSPRIGAALAVDPRTLLRMHTPDTTNCIRKGIAAYMFGGLRTASVSSAQDDLWQLWVSDNASCDSVEWVHLSPDSSAPAARGWHAAAFDYDSKRVMFFGGESNTTGVGITAAALDVGTAVADQVPSAFHYTWRAVTSLNDTVGISHGPAIYDGGTINARIPEFTSTTGSSPSWTAATAADSFYHRDPWYPFMFVMPDGRIFDAGSGNDDNHYSAVFNLSTQRWGLHPRTLTHQSLFVPGSAAMFRPGMVMAAGSRDEFFRSNPISNTGNLPAVGMTEVIDLNADSAATWHWSINEMYKGRLFHNLVILPTGDVMAVGGDSCATLQDSVLARAYAVRRPEIWSPDTTSSGKRGYWRGSSVNDTLLAEAHVQRDYHSTAILLPDGRILSAGGNASYPEAQKVEIYCPPYLFNADGSRAARPEYNLSSVPPTHLTYGQSFYVCLSSNTTAADVDSVVLIKPGAPTHGFDADQRFLRLPTTYCGAGYRLEVTSPANANLAPPGDYLMFLVYKNIVDRAANATPPPRYRTPSIARWVRLGYQWDNSSFCAGCGGGGCPYVDVAGISGWLSDNTILGRSANGTMSYDAYPLRMTPDTRSGLVTVRLRENEQEVTSLDAARLLAVDHGAGLTVVGDSSGVVVGRSVTAFRVTTSKGEDISSLLSDGGRGWWGSPGDTVLVDLDGPRAAASMQSGDGGGGMLDGDPKDEELVYRPGGTAKMQQSTRPALVTDADWLDQTGVRLQRRGGDGDWHDVGHWYPRQYGAKTYLPGLGHGQTRLIFVGRHKLTFAGRLATVTEGVSVTEVSASSAVHSRLGSVASELNTGGESTMLAPGDTITLQFAAPPSSEGAERDYVLVTRGVYTSDLGAARLTPSRTGLPLQFALRQNQPNPFGATTTINFELPQRSKVKIEVFDLFGRRVKTLTNQEWPAGYQHIDWDRTADNGSFVHAGVFMYRITAGSFRTQRKMVLLSR